MVFFCGCSAAGSASPCQGEGREFESRHPLWFPLCGYPCEAVSPRWNGRVVRQRSAKPCTRVRFPFPPRVTMTTSVIVSAISSVGRALPRHGRGHWFKSSIAHTGITESFRSSPRKPGLWFSFADVAQLVAHHLAKVRVASSSLVIRSKF